MQTSQQLNRPKSFCRATRNQRWIAAGTWFAIAVFFLVFGLAGHYRIDMGTFLGRCGFRQDTGLPCPTCGMTTAVLAFAQGNIRQAFYIQPAGGLLCCLAVFVAVLAFIISVFGVYFHSISRFFAAVKIRYIALALILILLSGWAVTFARAWAARP